MAWLWVISKHATLESPGAFSSRMVKASRQQKQDVIYGIIRQLNPQCLALNHLIILEKYFLYVNGLNTEKSSLIDFKGLVQDKIELEK